MHMEFSMLQELLERLKIEYEDACKKKGFAVSNSLNKHTILCMPQSQWHIHP